MSEGKAAGMTPDTTPDMADLFEALDTIGSGFHRACGSLAPLSIARAPAAPRPALRVCDGPCVGSDSREGGLPRPRIRDPAFALGSLQQSQVPSPLANFPLPGERVFAR